MNRTHRGWLVGTALMAASCGENEDRARDDTQAFEEVGFTEVKEIDGKLYALPIIDLEVQPGVTASFYVWEDLSAGYMMAYAEGGPMLPEAELNDLSIAEVFWALSPPETPVPAALLRHHEALVANDECPEWSEAIAALEQGWIMTVPAPRYLTECGNTWFLNNHCATGGGYVNSWCVFDSYGNWYHNVQWVYRYKAGFCIDHGGSSKDYLRYHELTSNYFCTSTGAITIWNNTWYSPTYLSWEWIMPSGWKRAWLHDGVAATGARDFGQKWGGTYVCP